MRGVNLIPVERRLAQQSRRRLRRWVGVMSVHVGLLLAACAGARMVWSHDTTAAADELTQVQRSIEMLDARLGLTKSQLSDAETARQTALTVSDQPDFSILLTLLGNSLGDEVVLREIQLKPDPKTPKDIQLQLRGFARTQPGVSQFVLRLQRLELFDEVKLQRTGREPVMSESAVTFDIVCTMTQAGRTAK